MPNREEIRSDFPVYRIAVGEGDSNIVVGFSKDSNNPGPVPVDLAVADFAQAVATLWGGTLTSVNRFDSSATPL